MKAVIHWLPRCLGTPTILQVSSRYKYQLSEENSFTAFEPHSCLIHPTRDDSCEALRFARSRSPPPEVKTREIMMHKVDSFFRNFYPLLFLLFFCPFVPYCFISTVSSTRSRSPLLSSKLFFGNLFTTTVSLHITNNNDI